MTSGALKRVGTISDKAIYLLLALLWAFSRLPLIDLGYGTDADAWRVAYQGWRMSQFGGYIWSRAPGYPVFELFVSKLADYGWIATNLSSVLMGFLGAIIFWKLLIEHARSSKFVATMLTIVYSFAPVVWIASSTTMDYLFAQTCILTSWYWMGKNRLSLSAIILGMAVGFRPTSGILILSMLVALAGGEDASAKKQRLFCLLKYLALFFLTSLILFLPVLITYGVNVLPALESRPSPVIAIYHIMEVFGLLGLGCLGVTGIFLAFRKLRQIKTNEMINRLRLLDRNAIFALFGFLSIVALFAYFPDEAGYLIPSVPFFLYLLAILNFSDLSYGNKAAKPILIVLTLVVMINGLFDLRLWKRDEYGQTQISMPYLGMGFVLEDARQRYAIMQEAEYILETGHFQLPCTILTGWHYPIIRVYKEMLSQEMQPDCQIVQLMSKTDLELAIRNNITVYYVPGVQSLAQNLYGYSFSEYPQTVYLNSVK